MAPQTTPAEIASGDANSSKLHDRIEVKPCQGSEEGLLPAVSPEQFRRACGRFATGITIATARAADGSPQGFTANSFTSVSLDPPLVLLCVDLRATVLPAFRESRHFGVNILHAGQQELSARFAQRPTDRFDGVEWQPGTTGVPLLAGVLAQLECAVSSVVQAGDHFIILGEVLEAQVEEGEPLLYFQSRYRALAPLATNASG